jgi:hypothetical protein
MACIRYKKVHEHYTPVLQVHRSSFKCIALYCTLYITGWDIRKTGSLQDVKDILAP